MKLSQVMLLAALAAAALLAAPVAAQQMPTNEDLAYSTQGIDLSRLALSNVSYSENGTALRGYWAYDKTMNGTRPAVVIVPDWDGIGTYERWRAHLLASLGYASFVADIFGADVQQGPSLPMANRSVLTRAFTGANGRAFRSRIIAALDVVRNQTAVVNASNIAAIGYCFGGSGMMELARAWPNGTAGLKGVVAFHPGGLTSQISNFTAGNPIIVSVQAGNNDPATPISSFDAFQKEAEAANITYELTRYGQTVHAFTEPALVGSQATAGTAYNRFADMRSWAALRSLLAMLFNQTPAGNAYTGPVAVSTPVTA